MITFTAVLSRFPGLDERRLLVWIEQEWVRPVQRQGELMFADIDLARLHLILDLEQFELGEGAMPVVLSLVDQLHTTRRHMRRLVEALDQGRRRRWCGERGLEAIARTRVIRLSMLHRGESICSVVSIDLHGKHPAYDDCADLCLGNGDTFATQFRRLSCPRPCP